MSETTVLILGVCIFRMCSLWSCLRRWSWTSFITDENMLLQLQLLL